MIVFDIDGTLADHSKREHLITPDRNPDSWDSYFENLADDEPVHITCELYRKHLMDCVRFRKTLPEIWTGRPEKYRKATMKWFDKNLRIRPPVIKMRADGDSTIDHLIKEGWVKEAQAEGKTIKAVFEDRLSVVDMYRRNGILCYHVGGGDY